MTSHQQRIKISDVTPDHHNFELRFEILETIARAKGILVCRVVDETGVIDACFDKFVDKLDKGFVYEVTHLKCTLIDGHPRVDMTSNSCISKQSGVIEFKDKSNDISKKVFNPSASQHKPVLKPELKKEQPRPESKTQQIKPGPKIQQPNVQKLIPFSEQEAKKQLKIKKQFDELYEKKKDVKKTKQGEEEGKSKAYKQREDAPPRRNTDAKIKANTSKRDQDTRQSPKKVNGYVEVKAGSSTKSEQKKYDAKKQTTIKKAKPKYEQKVEQGSKQTEDQNNLLIGLLDKVGKSVNIRVYVTNSRKNQKTSSVDYTVADSSGSVTLRATQLNLDKQECYEIKNVRVGNQDNKIYLAETNSSEVRRLDTTFNFKARDINERK